MGARAGKNPLLVNSLARGLTILRCFSETQRELTISEIARIAKLPQPTVWRLCHTLREMGYLRAAGGDRVRLGIPVLTLGFAGLHGMSPAEMVLPYMESLAGRHGGTVTLGKRSGLDIVFLQRCLGETIIFADFRRGSRVSILKSPTGWAYLAGLDSKSRVKLIAELKRANRAGWPQMRQGLETALRRFQTTGTIVSIGLMHRQLNAVSLPIRSRSGATVLGLTCGGIADVFTPKKLDEIGEELAVISQELGSMLSDETEADDEF